MKKIRFVFLLFTFILGLSIASNAATITFNDFSNVSSLKLNGDAFQAGTILRLTGAEDGKVGSAFLKDPISVESFSAHFTFQLHNKDYWGTADGFTFVLQSDPRKANAIGIGGGSLGYKPIKPSVAVEFDTYEPSTSSIPKYHVGIDVDGSINSITYQEVKYNLLYSDSEYRYAWIDYNNGLLSVYLSKTDTKPEDPILTHPLDLKKHLDTSNVYVGFTAATGALHEAHDILSWTFTYDEPSAAVPLPNTLWLLAPTLFSLIGLKRKIVEI